MTAFTASHQALDVLERTCSMRANFVFRIKNTRLSKRHRCRAMDQSPFCDQRASGSLHEAGLHLDSDDTHFLRNTDRKSVV